jgi:glycosyltransferase involved in cell wall biosynthesis
VASQILPRLGEVQEYIYSPSGRISALWSWLTASGRLWRDATSQKLDTLYLVCSRSTLGFLRDLPALLLSRLGLKVIVHAHGSDIVSLLHERRISPFVRWTYYRCALVVPSAHLLPDLGKSQFTACHICENFYQGEHPGAVNLNKSSKLSVLWNSNIMGSKGAFDLFEAARRLEDRGVPVDLKVIGRVLGDDEYTQSSAQSQLSIAIADGTVNFLGALSAKEANSLVTKVDVVALPSRYRSELQPLALIEAMCAGRAIVAGNTPALRATLDNYPAEFVPVHSVDDIADALERLDNERRSGPEAFVAKRSAPAAIARERFSSARFDQTLVAILNSAHNRSMN